jgi:hypothetical protein
VTVNVIPPNLVASDVDKFPFYSGWVKVNALSKNESYSGKPPCRIPRRIALELMLRVRVRQFLSLAFKLK